MLLRFAQAKDRIRSGDLLLFRRRGIVGWAIGVAGRSRYCHAAMAVWRRQCGWPVLRLLEMGFRGGRERSLGEAIEGEPGRIDWFEANPDDRWPEFDRTLAAAKICSYAGRRYGFRALAAAALRHLPLIRWWMRPPTDDEFGNGRAPMCSQAVAAACRAGGVDPVRGLSDRATEPADLARSPFFVYRATLIP
jgi:hypothetical protein